MGTRNGKQFKVFMFKEDVEMVVQLVVLHPAKETGGNLFGLWSDIQEPVLHVVLGPAVGCTRTEVSFYQSIPYLQRVGKVLTEQFQLCHIGEWHSHHKLHLSEPSTGDSSTVTRNFPRGTCGFLLIIANILPNGNVTLSPYLYKEGRSTYERGEIKLLGEYRSPFKEVEVIRRNIEIGEDKSSTIDEYRQLRARKDPDVKKSTPSRPNENNQEENTFACMFQDGYKIIQKQLGLVQGTKIEGDLLGLWTNDKAPVVHVVLEPNIKKEPQPVSPNHQPKITIQHRGYVVEGYSLENIGKYILCPNEQHEPSPEESSNMRRDYPNGGLLILAFWRFGESDISISPYLYCEGFKTYKPLVVKFLPHGKVFSQKINDCNGQDQEKDDHENMEVDEPGRASPNFEQHEVFQESW